MSVSRSRWAWILALTMMFSMLAGIAAADHPDPGGGQPEHDALEAPGDPSDPLEELDAAFSDVVSGGPSAKVIKNLQLRGRGERLDANATTDVWAHGDYAYTGTFNDPCGGDPEAGVWVWNVEDRDNPVFVDVIESPVGSRSNDVKVATLNSGDILVHSNESCAGGPGGFEIYNVDDPTNPVHLASVQTDDVNAFLRSAFGFVDFGVHNLFLFSQGDRDYVAAVVESEFGNFQVFDITDPGSPTLAGFWGAEELRMAELGEDPSTVPDLGAAEFGLILELDAYLISGFGESQNRFLHDITISADGTQAYLSNWDAGLVLLDISDVSDPTVVSVALDPANGSRDGEVNSHAAWPSEDGSIVVETEEDFNAWVTVQPLDNFTFGEHPWNTIPGVGVSTSAGDDFQANQTGNMVTVTANSVTVNSGPLAPNVYPATEGSGNQPKLANTGPLEAEAVWVGRACDTDRFSIGPPTDQPGVVDPLLNDPAGKIAVVRRGGCSFSSKMGHVADAGAIGVIVANNLTNDSPWGGVRIWDYSDPSNPELASIFDTTCSASPEPIPECDPFGTYSVHNVIVESRGNKTFAYISWYWDGMLVLDVTDPYNPVEVARYFDNSPAFLESNGGNPHDFWGVYKERRSPWIYGSDRNGGLYVFKEQGSGSGK
ncbi:MAG TPA: PA domain-containing protein [Actinomycetota bacterium]